jgi:hypothetical protein
MTTKGRLVLLVLPLALLMLTGCGPTRRAASKLSGKVTYKGAPVTAGTVQLHDPEGGVYSMPINHDGTYSGTDLPAGEMAVVIETESARLSRSMGEYGGGRGKEKGQGDKRTGVMSPMPEGVQPGATPAGKYMRIPAKYAKKETSGMTLNMGKGSNTKDFDLTD